MPYFPAKLAGDVFLIPNPDPARHYRWLSKDPGRLGDWLRAYGDIPGYELVQGTTLAETREKAIAIGLSADRVTCDNRIKVGMNVLASIPQIERDRRIQEGIEGQLERRRAAEDDFHAAAEEIPGVTSFAEEPEVTDEKAEFHSRTARPFSGQTGVGISPALARLRQATANK